MQLRKQRPFTGWFQLITYILLIGAVLLLTFAGGRVYQAVTAEKTAHEQLRSTTAFLQSQVAAADAAEQIVISSGPEGDALCLLFAQGSYQTVIYQYDGYLVEQVLSADAALQPEEADRIAPVEQFSARLLSATQLELQVDGCTVYAAVRSGRDG